MRTILWLASSAAAASANAALKCARCSRFSSCSSGSAPGSGSPAASSFWIGTSGALVSPRQQSMNVRVVVTRSQFCRNPCPVYDAIRGRWTRSLMVGGVPMNDLDGEETVVAESARGNAQYAYVWLGSVDPSLVADDLETTAAAFADRFARLGYPSDSRLDASETTATSIGRMDAVQLTRHYAYDVPGTPITGEELIVVAVDTGDTPAVCVASVPDGYPAVRRQAHLATESLRLR